MRDLATSLGGVELTRRKLRGKRRLERKQSECPRLKQGKQPQSGLRFLGQAKFSEATPVAVIL
jgi:hypothetical protein